MSTFTGAVHSARGMTLMFSAVRTVCPAVPSEVLLSVRTSVKQQTDDDGSNDHQQAEKQKAKMDHH